MLANGVEPKKPNPVDVEVGQRIRLRRKALQMSQTHLAQQLGITFQQVQKYEKGANRIGASRLVRIAAILNTTVQFLTNENTRDEPWMSMLLVQPYALEMLKVFTSIDDKRVCAKILDLTSEILQRQTSKGGRAQFESDVSVVLSQQ